jgi:hypothetical protein
MEGRNNDEKSGMEGKEEWSERRDGAIGRLGGKNERSNAWTWRVQGKEEWKK